MLIIVKKADKKAKKTSYDVVKKKGECVLKTDSGVSEQARADLIESKI